MMGMGMGLPPAKAKDFRGSLRRLLGHLRPEGPRIVVVVLLAVVSVTFAVIGPKILGDDDQRDLRGRRSVIAGLRAQGQTSSPTCSRRWRHAGRDRLPALDACCSSASTSELAVRLDPGLHHGRRHPADGPPPARDVDRKLGRLPLRYFDAIPAATS